MLKGQVVHRPHKKSGKVFSLLDNIFFKDTLSIGQEKKGGGGGDFLQDNYSERTGCVLAEQGMVKTASCWTCPPRLNQKVAISLIMQCVMFVSLHCAFVRDRSLTHSLPRNEPSFLAVVLPPPVE